MDTKTFAVAQYDDETGALKSVAYGQTFAEAKPAVALAEAWNDARSEDCGFHYKAVELNAGGEIVFDPTLYAMKSYATGLAIVFEGS